MVDDFQFDVQLKFMILDLVKRFTITGLEWKSPTIPKMKRDFILIPFRNKSIEYINMRMMLHTPHIEEVFHSVLQCDQIPMITYKYSKQIRNVVLNYAAAVHECVVEQVDEVRCDCQDFRDSKYFNPDHEHIITGHLDFVRDRQLQELLEKGPSYRNPVALDWDDGLEAIIEGIEAFVKRHCPKGKRKNVMKIISDELTQRVELLRGRTYSQKKPLLTKFSRTVLKRLHEKYVFCLVDKASNNIAIVCKAFYLTFLKAKLSASSVYRQVPHCEQEPIDWSPIVNSTVVQFGKSPYMNVKFHKNPVDTRDIASSAHCVTKPLAQLVTQALSKVMTQRRKYCSAIYRYSKVRTMWVIDNNAPFLNAVNRLSATQSLKSLETF